MANIANFVSVLLADASKSILFFICLISAINVISHCDGNEINQRFRSSLKEFQNREDNVEISAGISVRMDEKEFGQLKNRVVISDGETVVGGAGKKIKCLRIYWVHF